ncbi:hypothetical protein C8236_07630 [Paracidovorax avenae]|uniref:hypothetical protein n=1 Tax=Paracidovorax avenae TaxID=80867 RepID=UPI000D227615|nr:hypothetical protein [Paracidovorax avenae]AVS98719.1 hypothetical protein C8236_07630 [Paracidovorax avenae]
MHAKHIAVIAAGLAFTASTLAQVAYDPAKCAEVSGSLNIRWSQIAPFGVSCEGIETTNGTRVMAQAGRVQMQGISTTGGCLANDTYDLTFSADKRSLSGPIASSPGSITFTRNAGQACFTGHWVSGAIDILGYISADFFPPIAPTSAIGVPGMGAAGIAGTSALVLAAGLLRRRRRRR